MSTIHTVIFGTSSQMSEIATFIIDLLVTSPLYPMVKMYDNQFSILNPKLLQLWNDLETNKNETSLNKIYQLIRDSLEKTWTGPFRVLVDVESLVLILEMHPRKLMINLDFFQIMLKSSNYVKKLVSQLCLMSFGRKQQQNHYIGEKMFS